MSASVDPEGLLLACEWGSGGETAGSTPKQISSDRAEL